MLDSGPFVLHRKIQIHGSFQLTGEPQGAIKNDTSNPKCKGMLSNLVQREASYHIDFRAFISRNHGQSVLPNPISGMVGG